jgi:phosphate:Na+ symporter
VRHKENCFTVFGKRLSVIDAPKIRLFLDQGALMHGGELLLTLLGAVALLLWGVRMVRTGMTRAFGPMLRKAISRAGKNRFTAFAAGLGVTAVLQSATATALLLGSFAGSGLVALPVALAIMLGADVGSTLVAQVFAFDVKGVWAVGLFAGVVLFNVSESSQTKNTGRIAIGLGLMLLSLGLIGSVSAGLRESPAINTVLRALGSEPVIAMIVSALLTWLAHSSLAIILFIMSLAATGAVSSPLALALVLGANIGAAVIPLFAMSTAPVMARRVPLGNLIARSAIGLAALPLFKFAPTFIEMFGPSPARQVLNFHTAFNIMVALAFLPLIKPLAALAVRLLPDPQSAPDPSLPQHLDPTALDTPTEALACALRETLHVGDIVLDMLRRSLAVIGTPDAKSIKELEKTDDQVDRLHEAIKLYLIRASKLDMTEAESRRYVEILTFNTNLEHIGDIVDKNLMELAAKKLKKRVAFSTEGSAELQKFHGQVVDNMRLALNVFATRDVALARRLMQTKASLRTQEVDAADRHFARLRDGRPESIETSSIHLDIVRDLKRINSHLTSVAYPILDAAGELRETRLVDRTAAEVEAQPGLAANKL